MGLSQETGIAASLASGIIENFSSMTKPLHLGCTAQSALAAKRLAEAGLSSSPASIDH